MMLSKHGVANFLAIMLLVGAMGNVIWAQVGGGCPPGAGAAAINEECEDCNGQPVGICEECDNGVVKPKSGDIPSQPCYHCVNGQKLPKDDGEAVPGQECKRCVAGTVEDKITQFAIKTEKNNICVNSELFETDFTIVPSNHGGVWSWEGSSQPGTHSAYIKINGVTCKVAEYTVIASGQEHFLNEPPADVADPEENDSRIAIAGVYTHRTQYTYTGLTSYKLVSGPHDSGPGAIGQIGLQNIKTSSYAEELLLEVENPLAALGAPSVSYTLTKEWENTAQRNFTSTQAAVPGISWIARIYQASCTKSYTWVHHRSVSGGLFTLVAEDSGTLASGWLKAITIVWSKKCM